MVKKDVSKVAVPFGTEYKKTLVKELTIDGMTLGELYADWKNTKSVLVDLLEQLKGHYIVKEDCEYLVQLGDRLKHVDKLIVHKVEDLRYPLHFYKVKDGKLVVDKRKVASL